MIGHDGPSLDDLLAGMRVVSLPLRTRFRGITTREVALIQGPAGWGEFGPFLEYEPAEARRWLDAAIEAAYQGWPAPRRDQVPVNATVPAVAPPQVEAILARFPGCTTAKVKVAEPGQGQGADVDRVATVRAILGPHAAIRVDANGAWDVDSAADILGHLAAFELEYAEQPCATVEELHDLRVLLAHRGVDVAIAADESIRKAEDPLRVRDLGAADVIVVKVAPLGGVRAALEIVAECGLPAVVSSALDSSVGLAAGVALAAALPDLDLACGLGTAALLGGDVSDPPLLPFGGSLPVREVAPDADLLDRWAARPQRVDWWRERVAACVDTIGR